MTHEKDGVHSLKNLDNLQDCSAPSVVGHHEEGTDKKRCSRCFDCSCFSRLPRRIFTVFMGKHALGVLLIVCVAFIWVASSVWIQYIFGELNYEKPYLMTYFNTTCFALWNIGYIVMPSWRRVPWNNEEKAEPIIFTDDDLKVAYKYQQTFSDAEAGKATNEENNVVEYGTAVADGNTSRSTKMMAAPKIMSHTQQDGGEASLAPKPDKNCEVIKPYSKLRIIRCAVFFCPLWFLANYLFNLSLSKTSVASNTILSATSSIWTLLISILFFRQPVVIIKVIAVFVCFAGVMMVAFADGKKALEGDGIVGDVLALFSAFFYAGYTTVLNLVLPDDERYSMAMAFGAVGIVNFFIFWPGLPILNATDVEPFQLPTLQQLWPLILNTLIGTNLSDVLWARSVVLTSPVVATLGLSLTTPMAMVADIIFKKKNFVPLYIVGAIFVTFGFILINIEDRLMQAFLRRFLRLLRCGHHTDK